MNCPYLKGRDIKQCGAVECAVALSGCELKNFCTKEKYAFCPVFKAKTNIASAGLTINQYYAIYSNWVRKNVSRTAA